MTKEILIYTPIYSNVAADFIKSVSDCSGNDITVRINSDGGSPEDTFGMIAKLQEHKGKVNIKADGRARSMAAFFMCYATGESECLDTTEFLFHRAAFPRSVESNPALMTQAMRASLENINKHLRKAFESKINAVKFKNITGVSVDELFSLDSRVDVVINANDAKALGLVKSITTITPKAMQLIKSTGYQIAAHYGISANADSDENLTQTQKALLILADTRRILAEHQAERKNTIAFWAEVARLTGRAEIANHAYDPPVEKQARKSTGGIIGTFSYKE